MPRTVETRQNFKSRVVSTVYKTRELLIECMGKLSLRHIKPLQLNKLALNVECYKNQHLLIS